MKESVAVAKEADAKKGVSPTKSGDSIYRIRNEPEWQLGSLRDVIGNIRRDGGTPSVESIATELSGVPTGERAPALLALQQTHGNRYVQRVVAGIQAKLKVGQPNDIYEQEADDVADLVMRMPDPIENKTGPTANMTHRLSRSPLNRERINPQPIEEEEEMLQAKMEGQRQSRNTPSQTESRINAMKGGGQPLSHNERRFFEPRLGADFKQVRIHHGTPDGDQTASDLSAKAFTIGQNIFFGAGRYSPETEAGQRLMAHELTHVMQQSGDQLQSTQAHTIIDAPVSLAAPISVMRDLTTEERETIEEQAFELIRSDLLEGIPLTGEPGDPEITAEAIAKLEVIRTILEDVHRDLNTVLIMLQNLEEMQLPEVFTWDFLIDVLEEGTDAVVVALPEKLESIGAVAGFIFKMIVLTTARYLQTSARNEQLEGRNFTIQFILQQMQMARTQVDLLMVAARSEANVAAELAGLTVPETPGEVSSRISGDIEFVLTKSLIKRQGGVLALRHTDQLNVNTDRVNYEETEHYRVAQQRHQNPADNWYLYESSPRSGLLPLHPTADTAYYWRVLIVEDVAEQVINHILTRMQANGIPKARLYHLGDPSDLPMDDHTPSLTSPAIWSLADVIE